jgi:ubiquinone/menaquinone biosynthesis C-methylase UbiE
MHTDEQSPVAALRRMILGYRFSQALCVAAELGIADLLKDRPRSIDDLAQATGVHPPSLYRLLRLLASEGVFVEQEHGRFGLTPLAVPLQRDAPVTLRARAIFDGAEGNWRAWGHLMHSVMTGEPAFDHTFEMRFFDYLRQHPTAGASFDALMAEQTLPWAQAIVDAYDFSSIGTLVDVGGGYGTLLGAILAAHRRLRGVLYDLPHVIAGARPRLTAAGVTDRCDAIAGDFFAAVPDGGDSYLLKHILHDWDDDRCIAILGNCRRVMPTGGRLLVVEVIIPPNNDPHYGKYLDLNMLVLYTGRERTEAEYRKLFEATGFALAQVVETASEVSVIEGRPV